MTSRKPWIAILSVFGVVALVFTMAPASPSAEAQGDACCTACASQFAVCLRAETRILKQEGAEVDLPAAMQAIAEYVRCRTDACSGEPVDCVLGEAIPLEAISACILVACDVGACKPTR
jgi:hypothetical protein